MNKKIIKLSASLFSITMTCNVFCMGKSVLQKQSTFNACQSKHHDTYNNSKECRSPTPRSNSIAPNQHQATVQNKNAQQGKVIGEKLQTRKQEALNKGQQENKNQNQFTLIEKALSNRFKDTKTSSGSSSLDAIIEYLKSKPFENCKDLIISILDIASAKQYTNGTPQYVQKYNTIIQDKQDKHIQAKKREYTKEIHDQIKSGSITIQLRHLLINQTGIQDISVDAEQTIEYNGMSKTINNIINGIKDHNIINEFQQFIIQTQNSISSPVYSSNTDNAQKLKNIFAILYIYKNISASNIKHISNNLDGLLEQAKKYFSKTNVLTKIEAELCLLRAIQAHLNGIVQKEKEKEENEKAKGEILQIVHGLNGKQKQIERMYDESQKQINQMNNEIKQIEKSYKHYDKTELATLKNKIQEAQDIVKVRTYEKHIKNIATHIAGLIEKETDVGQLKSEIKSIIDRINPDNATKLITIPDTTANMLDIQIQLKDLKDIQEKIEKLQQDAQKYQLECKNIVGLIEKRIEAINEIKKQIGTETASDNFYGYGLIEKKYFIIRIEQSMQNTDNNAHITQRITQEQLKQFINGAKQYATTLQNHLDTSKGYLSSLKTHIKVNDFDIKTMLKADNKTIISGIDQYCNINNITVTNSKELENFCKTDIIQRGLQDNNLQSLGKKLDTEYEQHIDKIFDERSKILLGKIDSQTKEQLQDIKTKLEEIKTHLHNHWQTEHHINLITYSEIVKKIDDMILKIIGNNKLEKLKNDIKSELAKLEEINTDKLKQLMQQNKNLSRCIVDIAAVLASTEQTQGIQSLYQEAEGRKEKIQGLINKYAKINEESKQMKICMQNQLNDNNQDQELSKMLKKIQEFHKSQIEKSILEKEGEEKEIETNINTAKESLTQIFENFIISKQKEFADENKYLSQLNNELIKLNQNLNELNQHSQNATNDDSFATKITNINGQIEQLTGLKSELQTELRKTDSEKGNTQTFTQKAKEQIQKIQNAQKGLEQLLNKQIEYVKLCITYKKLEIENSRLKTKKDGIEDDIKQALQEIENNNNDVSMSYAMREALNDYKNDVKKQQQKLEVVDEKFAKVKMLFEKEKTKEQSGDIAQLLNEIENELSDINAQLKSAKEDIDSRSRKILLSNISYVKAHNRKSIAEFVLNATHIFDIHKIISNFEKIELDYRTIIEFLKIVEVYKKHVGNSFINRNTQGILQNLAYNKPIFGAANEIDNSGHSNLANEILLVNLIKKHCGITINDWKNIDMDQLKATINRLSKDEKKKIITALKEIKILSKNQQDITQAISSIQDLIV